MADTRKSQGRSSQKPERRARGSLSSDEILGKAQELIERDGFAGFSMPALARDVGCGVMTIYWYFRNKETLILAVAERVTADVHARLPPIDPSAPWREAYRDRLAALRREFESSRAFVEVFVAHREELYADRAITELVNEQSNQAVDLLRSAGFTADDARKLHLVCIGFVRGFVLHEHPWVLGVSEDWGERSTQRRPAGGRQTPKTPSPFDDELFDFSVDLLLTGMQAQLDAQQPRKKPATRPAKTGPSGSVS